MSSNRNIAHFLALALAVTATASADIVSLAPVKDNTLYEVTEPDRTTKGSFEYLSNGIGQHLFVGRTTQQVNTLRRALVAFDVAAALPAGATINSVTLEMTMTQTISGDEPVSLHRALADWGEGLSEATLGGGGGGAPAEPGDATWIHTFFDTDFWTTQGGDFAALASATQQVGGEATYVWGSTAGMVADAQDWLDNPSTNFGWVVVGNEAALGTAKRFGSRETPVRGLVAGPRLVIDFAGPVPVGPPSIPTLSPVGIAAMALALAFAGMWLRRRKVGV